MASGKISIYQGNSWGPFAPELRWADGSPYVIPVGATILFTVKLPGDSTDNDDDAVIKKDWSSGSWALTGADTAIRIRDYVYDLKIIASGIKVNSASGVFEILRPVGRRDSN